jgi:hypothetical protein
MNTFCKVIVIIFALLYLFALAILAIGTFGLFGQERDPLSGVYLVPLGLPWIFLVEDVPESARPWLGSLAPAVNLLLLWLICRFASRRRA